MGRDGKIRPTTYQPRRTTAVLARGRREEQNRAALLKLQAERKAGELLREMEHHPVGRPAKKNPVRDEEDYELPTFADLGIGYNDSHRWQTEALLPEPLFDALLTEDEEEPGWEEEDDAEEESGDLRSPVGDLKSEGHKPLREIAPRFGDTYRTAQRRITVVRAADAEPERYGKHLAAMNRTGKVNTAAEVLSGMSR